MRLRRYIAALFLLGVPTCRRCGGRVSMRLMNDAEMRDVLMDDELICLGCSSKEAGRDPWRITFVVGD